MLQHMANWLPKLPLVERIGTAFVMRSQVLMRSQVRGMNMSPCPAHQAFYADLESLGVLLLLTGAPSHAHVIRAVWCCCGADHHLPSC